MFHVVSKTSLRSLAVGAALVSACGAADLTIDGTSDSAFQVSHDELLHSLTPEDRLRFVLAEAIYLAPLACAEHRERLESESLTKVLGGKISLEACRQELDGKSYNDIMRLAYPPDGKVPAGTLPESSNKSLERSRDR